MSLDILRRAAIKTVTEKMGSTYRAVALECSVTIKTAAVKGFSKEDIDFNAKNSITVTGVRAALEKFKVRLNGTCV